MEIIDVIDRNSDLIKELTALWRRSVSKTHTFLTGKDIDEIENYVPQALGKVEHLVVAQKLANHRNIATTQRYFNYNEKMLANAVENVRV